MPVLLAALVLAAVVAAVVYVPRVADGKAKDDTLSQCAALQAQLAAMGQGGDPTSRASINAQLDDCVRRAQALGLDIDASNVKLAECDAAAAQIAGEWGNYLSTVNTDLLKRNNTRGTMLRLGGDLATLYGEAVALATSAAGLDLARASMLKAIEASIARERAFNIGTGGAGTFASNEPQTDEKAADENARICAPILAQYHASLAVSYAKGWPATIIAGPYGRRCPATVLAQRCSVWLDQRDGEWNAYLGVDSGDVAQREAKRAHMGRLAQFIHAGLVDAQGVLNTQGTAEDAIGAKSIAMRALTHHTNVYNAFSSHAPGAARGTFSAEPTDEQKAADERGYLLDVQAIAVDFDQAARSVPPTINVGALASIGGLRPGLIHIGGVS